MHPYLQRQELEYGIFVVEQEGNEIFNKGILMNTAFNFIFNSNNNEFDCVLYHDVDLLPTGFYNYLNLNLLILQMVFFFQMI